MSDPIELQIPPDSPICLMCWQSEDWAAVERAIALAELPAPIRDVQDFFSTSTGWGRPTGKGFYFDQAARPAVEAWLTSSKRDWKLKVFTFKKQAIKEAA